MKEDKPSKKQTSKEVFDKLSAALIEYKGKLAKRKLEGRLRKMSKQLAADVVKSLKKARKAKKKLNRQ